MTPQEVEEASEGAAPMDSDILGYHIDGFQIGNVGTYETKKYKFKAIFQYKDEKLKLVQLDPVGEGKCRSLEDNMKDRYGKPFERTKVTITWRDESRNNKVTFVKVNELCGIRYEPIKDEGTSGL